MRHAMTVDTPYDGQHVFTCTECPRQVVLTHGRLTILDHGDFYALHSGSNRPEAMTVSAGGVEQR